MLTELTITNNKNKGEDKFIGLIASKGKYLFLSEMNSHKSWVFS